MSGGGWNPPGGGFGQPPGGGGGFGQPPGGTPPGGGMPPAGGGFPPGGGIHPGGGGGSPPGGGGDAPLGRIPFSPEDDKTIQQTALFMKVAGGLAIVSALFGLVGSIAVNVYMNLPPLGSLCTGGVSIGVQGLLATLLFISASRFEKIVTTDGEDQHHLAQGLKQLRVYFLVKAVLWVLGFLLCCCGLILAVTMGAAIFSVLAGAAGSQ